MEKSNFSLTYRPEIDGLRAFAVIPVIFFHAGFKLFSGGFVGVDVFFVISGYLITSIILSEMEDGKFSLINFYERRARRILPALFFGIYNVGFQSQEIINKDFISCFLYGLKIVLPMYLVVFGIGGLFEALFAVVRKHEINEGFLVTGFLIPLKFVLRCMSKRNSAGLGTSSPTVSPFFTGFLTVCPLFNQCFEGFKIK